MLSILVMCAAFLGEVLPVSRFVGLCNLERARRRDAPFFDSHAILRIAVFLHPQMPHTLVPGDSGDTTIP